MKEKFNKGKESEGKKNFKDGRADFKVGGGQRRPSTSAEKAPKDFGNQKEVTCFRCQKPGYFLIGCALPRKIACYFDGMEKDLENFEVKGRKKPRELPYRRVFLFCFFF